jgi:DMSO reductase anchor subunit
MLKQKNLKGIGAFIEIAYFCMPLFGAVSYIMGAITMYAVVYPYVHPVVPWLTMPLFFGIILVCGLSVMTLFYLFVYPSWWAFKNSQEYKHDSLLRKDLETIKAQNVSIMAKLGVTDAR